jgi:hypothetical protein
MLLFRLVAVSQEARFRSEDVLELFDSSQSLVAMDKEREVDKALMLPEQWCFLVELVFQQ